MRECSAMLSLLYAFMATIVNAMLTSEIIEYTHRQTDRQRGKGVTQRPAIRDKIEYKIEVDLSDRGRHSLEAHTREGSSAII